MTNFKEITVKEIKLKNCTRYYISIDLNNADTDLISSLYLKVISEIRVKKLQVVFEKIFGKIEYKRKFYNMREALLKNEAVQAFPSTFIEGFPVTNSCLSSITFFCVSQNVDIEYITEDNLYVGCVINQPEERALYLNNFSVDEKSLTSINHNVYDTIFSNIKRKILSSNFKPTDLVRNWIYLNHIYSNYVEFNQARNNFFTENNIQYTANSNDLPASTCIEGRSSENSIVSIDCLLVDKSLSEPTIQRVYSNLQNEPDGVTYENKPSFARAVALKYQDRIELQISGTASIDNHGITVYENDPKKQIRTTLLSVLHLLEQFGMGFSDFCLSTVFLKSADYYQIYKEVLEELHISEFSVSFVQTNVCRNNLLCEIDGVCIKK